MPHSAAAHRDAGHTSLFEFEFFASELGTHLTPCQTVICGPDCIDVDQVWSHLHLVPEDFEGSKVLEAFEATLRGWSQAITIPIPHPHITLEEREYAPCARDSDGGRVQDELSAFLSFTTGVSNLQPDGSMDNPEVLAALPRQRTRGLAG